MKPGRQGTSMLHLQMGQETIYLLLVTSLFVSACLAAYVLQLKGPERAPPILTLSETQGFSFETGSSDISRIFKDKLQQDVVPRLRKESVAYDAHVIEVIGHTDETPLHGKASNLDRTLLPWLNERPGLQARPVDNVGLGMTRAVAVARMLRQLGLDQTFTIIPLSAGPVVRPGGIVSDGSTRGDDRERRRIELRLLRRS